MKDKKQLLLFAGTTEGRELALWLSGIGCRGAVSAATRYGAELLEDELGAQGSLDILTGRLDEKQMEELFAAYEPSLVIDATHPYALLVTKNLKEACKNWGKARYLRCLRKEGLKEEEEGQIHLFKTMEEAARWLDCREGTIFVTTGSKELEAFAAIKDYRNRVYVRVLPMEPSIEACRKQGFEGRHIIAMQGPFSKELNLALLKEYGCRFLVTKDGGRAGGLHEKLQAAREAGAEAVVISRPGEEGSTLEEIKLYVKEWLDGEP
jgi:precorrin-6A/cobalt-precorrin-6A reductase